MKMNDLNLNRRIGKFTIDQNDFENNTDAVEEIFSRVLITDCRFSFVTRCFHYVGISKMFTKLRNGQKPKRYIVQYEKIEVARGNTRTFFKRFATANNQ